MYATEVINLVKAHGSLLPSTLRRLYYTDADIEQAVKSGLIQWQNGRLTPTEAL